ncbi:MAG TPA: DNA gyrase subunit A [Aeromonadales bacterium]|nr:DNA gyrase subunit A [Aeromonadales bacterium]
MSDMGKEIVPVSIEHEMKTSYLDYAMSVIVGRALPDIRDGLKPVHRRVLFAMNDLSNHYNKPYKKSARVVGDVIGKYHPHGDTAVYDTMVRMAQPFSLRYMLVDGQGNFGSVDGDSPAAMRYTEVRMHRMAHELLADLDKETVNFVDNYDGSESEPTVLPARIPNLLINGSSGIAVGMATNIPPHNITEVINGCLALMDNPDITVDELMTYIPGPDFPTAAFINGRKGIVDAYKTGRGKIYLRARSHFEEIAGTTQGRQQIVVDELPYQVNKARLLEKIAELVKEKKIEGISALRDESDKDGMRMVIELRRGEVPEVILNNLYAQTQLQTVFGINMVALQNGQPGLFNLFQMLDAFINHRREVVTRRTIYELRKAREKAHVLEGLAIALANIDEVIDLIKKSPSPAEAKKQLLAKNWSLGDVSEMLERAGADACRPDGLGKEFGVVDKSYRLSMEQAQAILELRLHRLTGLEHDKILNDYRALIDVIAELMLILSSKTRLMEVIREELEEVQQKYGDDRRSEILDSKLDLTLEDLITEQDVVVTLSHEGYCKYQPLQDYQAQRRGGRGKSATKMKEQDFIERLLVASTHDTILCFSDKGKVYWLKVYELPEAGRGARGKPIVNLLPLDDDEKIAFILPVRDYRDDQYVFMAYSTGVVKKTPLIDFSRPRANGIIATNLQPGECLIGVNLTDGNNDVMLFSNSGKAIRFHEDQVRSMGRTARGVRGMKLKGDDKLISLLVVEDDAQVLVASENGYGKRTAMSDFPVRGRGGQGVIAIQTSDRNGDVVRAIPVIEGDEFMLITNGATLIRSRVDEVRVMGRNTQGVTLIKLSKGELLAGMQRIEELPDIEPPEGTSEEDSEAEAAETKAESASEGNDSATNPDADNSEADNNDTEESPDV